MEKVISLPLGDQAGQSARAGGVWASKNSGCTRRRGRDSRRRIRNGHLGSAGRRAEQRQNAGYRRDSFPAHAWFSLIDPARRRFISQRHMIAVGGAG